MKKEQEKSIKDNLKQSMYITFGSFLVGALLFLVTYILIGIIWFLILAVVCFTASIAFVFVIKSLENRYLPAIKKQETENEK